MGKRIRLKCWSLRLSSVADFNKAHTKTHLKSYVWLVNGTEHRNYEEIKFFAEGFGVPLNTISEVITLITSLIANTTSINYAHNNYTHIVTNCNSNNSISKNLIDNKKSEIADLNPDKEVDKAKKLGLFDDYGFSS